MADGMSSAKSIEAVLNFEGISFPFQVSRCIQQGTVQANRLFGILMMCCYDRLRKAFSGGGMVWGGAHPRGDSVPSRR